MQQELYIKSNLHPFADRKIYLQLMTMFSVLKEQNLIYVQTHVFTLFRMTMRGVSGERPGRDVLRTIRTLWDWEEMTTSTVMDGE